MKNYFTNIELIANSYVGTVFDASNNQEVYKTKPYPTQSQAIQDTNIYLTTSSSPVTSPIPVPQTITNTTLHVPGAPTGQRRCCGR